MRSSVFALMLALAQCQQICKINNYVDYTDPECKNQKDFHTPEVYDFIINRLNEIAGNGTKPQRFEPNNENKTDLLKITCLDSETIKVQGCNYKGEDPECKYPYPSYADYPSYVAKSGACVRITPWSWGMFDISGTTDKFETTTESWELAPYDKTQNATQTKEEEQDMSTSANQCMVTEFQKFADPSCKEELSMADVKQFTDYYLYLQNFNINSTECNFPLNNGPKGIKARSYCLDEKTVRFNFYNVMNEDPRCKRSYPDSIKWDNSATVSDGQCVRLDDNYYKFKIVPYDGREWEMKPEWKDFKFKQLMDADKQKDGQKQSFSFEMNGMSFSTELDMKEGGYKNTYTMKFDNYFMYGIDYMGEDGYGMPPCGPEAEYDMCKEKVFSQETCCSHVVTDKVLEYVVESSGAPKTTQSFYRCMNRKVVDASFSFEIDGMKMSMSCTGDNKAGAATFLSSSAILASLVTLIALAGF